MIKQEYMTGLFYGRLKGQNRIVFSTFETFSKHQKQIIQYYMSHDISIKFSMTDMTEILQDVKSNEEGVRALDAVQQVYIKKLKPVTDERYLVLFERTIRGKKIYGEEMTKILTRAFKKIDRVAHSGTNRVLTVKPIFLKLKNGISND